MTQAQKGIRQKKALTKAELTQKIKQLEASIGIMHEQTMEAQNVMHQFAQRMESERLRAGAQWKVICEHLGPDGSDFEHGAMPKGFLQSEFEVTLEGDVEVYNAEIQRRFEEYEANVMKEAEEMAAATKAVDHCYDDDELPELELQLPSSCAQDVKAESSEVEDSTEETQSE